jgi:fatty-acyl-CoA synthase
MMPMPLSTQMILRHGRRLHAASRVSTFDGTGFATSTFAEVAVRAEALAAALAALGVRRNDRVATFCWNHAAHLEAYLAVPAMGAVLHTLNVRLYPQQIAQIARHAEDRVLIVDASLWDGIASVLRDVGSLQHVIVIGSGAVIGAGAHATAPGVVVHDYETLLAARLGRGFEWPDLDENSAAVACYTSGTTGDPKGIVYSHRSIFLHTLATLGVDAFAVSQHDRILLLPSMFHANAWGLPYSAWFAGADLILPGPHLKADAIRRMIREVRPTFTARCADADQRPARGRSPRSGRHVVVPGSRVRGLGRVARADSHGAGALGYSGAAGLGHDRDEPRCAVCRCRRGT